MAATRAGVHFPIGRKLGLACAVALLALPVAPAQAQQKENPPVPSVCKLTAGQTASTCLFTANAAGLPVFARTEFPDEFDVTNPDPLNTAEHELFHAIGFTTAYARFGAKLIPTPGAGAGGIPAGSRSYSNNGKAGGILMTLVPAADGTHADPGATGAAPWPATGYDQANDIMQPNQVVGNRLNALDAIILDDAFGWGTSGIQINIINVGGTLDATDLKFLTDAIAAVNAFYPSKKDSPVFTWAVAEVGLVPEAGTWVTMVIGFGLAGAALRRRAADRRDGMIEI